MAFGVFNRDDDPMLSETNVACTDCLHLATRCAPLALWIMAHALQTLVMSTYQLV